MSAITSTVNQALSQAHAAALGSPREVLSFRLGQEEYGIDILRVQEIRGYELPTRIANSPPFMKGVVNLRGRSCDGERMLILMDIETMMRSAVMGLMDVTIH